jgi:flagellar motor switch protein FliN/FliY
VSSFLSQKEIEDMVKRLNPDAGGFETEEKAAEQPGRVQDEQGSLDRESQVLDAQEMEHVEFPELQADTSQAQRRGVGFFQSVTVQLTLELGSAELTVRDILSLRKGSVIKLNKLAGENATLCVNSKPLTTGEVVVINDNFGFRVAEPGDKQMPGHERERR